MLEWFSDSAVAILMVMLITPVATGQATFIFTPISMVVTAGVFAKGITLAFEAADELEADAADFLGNLEWVNKCVDQKAQIDISSFEQGQKDMSHVASQIRILAKMMCT